MANLQQLPSYEALLVRSEPPRLSQDFLRLRWKPFGLLATSVHVASSARDPPSATDPAYRQGTAGYHPISESSLTEPPISSIRVTQANLDDWEDDWVDEHLPHADDESAVWVQGDERSAGTDATGTEDDEQLGDDETGRRLVRCCDEDRPPARSSSIVVRSSSKPYVTIHDYITAVHDWLQTHRDDILRAKGVHEGGPVPADTALYLEPMSIKAVTLNDGNGTADFAWLWSRVAQYADRLGGAGGGFPTPAWIAAARQPLNPQNIGPNFPQGPATRAPFSMPWQYRGPPPPPAVPGELMQRRAD